MKNTLHFNFVTKSRAMEDKERFSGRDLLYYSKVISRGCEKEESKL